MTIHTELFQMLVAAPNAPPKSLPEHIRKCLRALEDAGVQVGNSGLNLVTQGRAEYLALLASRALHFWNRSRPLGEQIARRGTPSLTAMELEHLRDFHHDAYYAVFYVARYALVSLRFYDCTSHDGYEKLLAQSADDSSLSRPDADKLLKISVRISEQKPHRNDADYIIGSPRLAGLGNQQVLENIITQTDSLLSDWNIR